MDNRLILVILLVILSWISVGTYAQSQYIAMEVSNGVTSAPDESMAASMTSAPDMGTVGDSMWAAEGRLSQVPVHRGAVTTWIGFVQSQVVQSLEDHAGNTPN